MKIEYKTKGIRVSQALDTWLKKRLKKFERLDDSATATVIIRRNQEKGPVEVDVMLRTHWGQIQSKNSAYDEKTALSRALTKIEEQFRRFKEKQTLARRRRTQEAVQRIEEGNFRSEIEFRLQALPPRVFPLLRLDEAIAMVREQGEAFVLFRDMENEEELTLLYPEDDQTINLVRFSRS